MKASKTTQSQEQKEELALKVEKAKKKLKKYFKANGLDPNKDYSKDKEHGPAITKLLKVIESGRKKLGDILDQDPKAKTKVKNRKDVKVQDDKKTKKESKAKAETRPAKYDYPTIKENGKEREMTASEKKKYRAEMRKQNAEPTSKKEKPPKEKSKETVKESTSKKAKDAKKEEKPSKKDKASKKEKKGKSGPKDD